MIKVKVNNEYKDVVKIFCGGTLQKEIVKVWSREAQEYVYESSVEYTGSLPITINANGDALLDYRIYGTDGGVGEPTENLIDADNPGAQRVELEPNTDYCLCKYTGSKQGGSPQCDVYDENDNKLFGDYIYVWVSYSFTNPSNGAYAIISFNSAAKGKLSFTKGRADMDDSLYPADYIPYGYKLPMVSMEALYMTVEQGNIDWMTGDDVSMTIRIRTVGKTPVKPATTYTFKYDASDSSIQWALRFYNGSTFLPSASSPWKNITYTTFTTPNNCDAVRMIFHYPDDYKDIVPSDVTNTRIYEKSSVITTPVYIGDTPLEEDEYVSYGEQKVYKRTENLWNPNTAEKKYIAFDGRVLNNPGYALNIIPIESDSNYYFYALENYLDNITYWQYRNNNDEIIGYDRNGRALQRAGFTAPEGATKVIICFANAWVDDKIRDFGLYQRSTAPTEYIPYLQPTGTPVPLPEIPTIKGETVIDYDGEPKPSQMYVKYRR